MQSLAIPGFARVFRLECAGSTAFLAIHRTVEGRAVGGVRIRSYTDEADALADALALARAMSRKAALAELPGGGAKTVVIAPPPAARAAVLRALAAVIDRLGGAYLAGADYGVTAADDALLGEATPFFARGDLDRATADGVLAAMTALFEPTRVALQGLGRVGSALAHALVARGIEVVAADPQGPRGGLPPGIQRVPAAALAAIPCDVFAPCALGGLVDGPTIAALRCRLVCGAANNPLATTADAERLHRRGITYIPDFVANVGALIHGVSRALGESPAIPARMAALGPRVRELVAQAEAAGVSPATVALAVADARLARTCDDPRAPWRGDVA